jgi:sec-independent protein translocase protein TatA
VEFPPAHFYFKNYFMGNMGFQEILLIAVVVLVLFGAKKIPDFMKGLGKGIREFNDAKTKVTSDITEQLKEPVMASTEK